MPRKPEPSPASAARLAVDDAARAKPAAEPARRIPENEVAQFCSNVTDPAVDARVAWQLKELEAAEPKLRQRIAEVEAKRAEYEKWMELRDEFLKKAEDSVVEIYSRMRPEAAATQIAGMSDETAAAVLAKLARGVRARSSTRWIRRGRRISPNPRRNAAWTTERHANEKACVFILRSSCPERLRAELPS